MRSRRRPIERSRPAGSPWRQASSTCTRTPTSRCPRFRRRRTRSARASRPKSSACAAFRRRRCRPIPSGPTSCASLVAASVPTSTGAGRASTPSSRDWTRRRPATNVAPLVGHGALRIAALGMADRAPSEAELAHMRAELRTRSSAGAWGMSTGLVYAPGAFAATSELHALGEELRQADALYVSHIRNEGDGLLDAVQEAIAIGQRNGIRAQVSHLKATGRKNLGRTTDAVALLDRLDAAGRAPTATSTRTPPAAPSCTRCSRRGPKRAACRACSSDCACPAAPAHPPRHRARPTGLGQSPRSRRWLAQRHDRQRHLARVARGRGPRASRSLRRRRARTRSTTSLDLLLADRGATVMVVFLMDESDVALRCRRRSPGSARTCSA